MYLRVFMLLTVGQKESNNLKDIPCNKLPGMIYKTEKQMSYEEMIDPGIDYLLSIVRTQTER